jgi:CMP-N-acetylneuraminic acid synthetase
MKNIEKIDAAAVIPIKTNNQRLPDKNTKILGDKPLLNHLFDKLYENEYFSEVFIDSSDESILKIATDYGFTPIKRSEVLNSSKTHGNELLNFELESIFYPIIAQLFVTLPFLKNSTINSALNQLIENQNVDSIFGIYNIYNRFWFEKKAINHNPYKLDGTQYIKSINAEAGFYVFRREAFLKEKTRITKKHSTIEVSKIEAIDIDDEFDFRIAEALVKQGIIDQ